MLDADRQCCGAGPLLTGSGSRYFFFTGSGSSSYKNRLKSSKKHVFAFTSLHRLRLRPKKYQLGPAPQHCRSELFLPGSGTNFFTSWIRIRIKMIRICHTAHRVKLLRDGTAAGHPCVMSPLRQILLGQQFQCNNLHTYFPTRMTQFRTLLTGLNPFLATLSSIYSQKEMRGVYTYAIGLPC